MGVASWAQRRAAKAAEVAANDAVSLPKAGPLRLPHATVTDAGVEEDERRSFAGDFGVQPRGGRGSHAAASSPRLALIPSRSSLNESANFCTPSSSRTLTTSS